MELSIGCRLLSQREEDWQNSEQSRPSPNTPTVVSWAKLQLQTEIKACKAYIIKTVWSTKS